MITYKKEPDSVERINNTLIASVKEWFYKTFPSLSLPQQFCVYDIHCRKNTLLSAPTGSTKTLTAFLSILNELIDLEQKGLLQDKTYAIYLSPLKALNYDIEQNLLRPLEQIYDIIGKKTTIRVGVRTGDTTAYKRQQMNKKPPHILITTPESLGLLLANDSYKKHLDSINWVIIDEIHALANNKRGVQLTLLLALLEKLSPQFCRIGLSATISPLDDVAQYLVGSQDCQIVQITQLKDIELEIKTVSDFYRLDYTDMQTQFYSLVHETIQSHKLVLIFTNTRAQTEKIVYELKTRFEGDYYEIQEEPPFDRSQLIAAHHGSLSYDLRKTIEQSLRDGKLRAVVCSTSLELGIDIGQVDYVIQINSPKSIARLIQRLGRAGHQLHANPKGCIIAQNHEDLLESSAIVKRVFEQDLDDIHIPTLCYDVLCQFIVLCSLYKLSVNDVYSMVKQTYPYKKLTKQQLHQCIDALCDIQEKMHIYPKLICEDDVLLPRKQTARIYRMNQGTIADSGGITVKWGTTIIGSIDEGFLESLQPNDVFVLGGEAYRFSHAKGMVAYVKSVVGKRPTVPRWFSRALGLTYKAALATAQLRDRLTQKELEDLHVQHPKILLEYKKLQSQASIEPTLHSLVIETYTDEQHYTIIHSLYGRRVNETLALLFSFVCQTTVHTPVQYGVSDFGFFLVSDKAIAIQTLLDGICQPGTEKILSHAIERAEMYKRRVRQCAYRSLILLKRYKEQKTVGKQQLKSHFFYYEMKRLYDHHPVLVEAKRELLEDVFDIAQACSIVQDIRSKKIKIQTTHSKIPSPYAMHLVSQQMADILKPAEKHAYLQNMYNLTLANIALSAKKKKKAYEFENPAPIAYEKVWGEKKESKAIDLTTQASRIAKQLHLESDIAYDLQRYVAGEQSGYTAKFKAWLSDLLSGAIPRIWSDELISYLKENTHLFK